LQTRLTEEPAVSNVKLRRPPALLNSLRDETTPPSRLAADSPRGLERIGRGANPAGCSRLSRIWVSQGRSTKGWMLPAWGRRFWSRTLLQPSPECDPPCPAGSAWPAQFPTCRFSRKIARDLSGAHHSSKPCQRGACGERRHRSQARCLPGFLVWRRKPHRNRLRAGDRPLP